MSTRPKTRKNDQMFNFLTLQFNISHLYRLVKEQSVQPTKVTFLVEDLKSMIPPDPKTATETERMIISLMSVGLDWEYVDQMEESELDRPVLVAELGDLGHLLIDGWHRAALALRLGRPALNADVIDRETAASILTPQSAALPV